MTREIGNNLLMGLLIKYNKHCASIIKNLQNSPYSHGREQYQDN